MGREMKREKIIKRRINGEGSSVSKTLNVGHLYLEMEGKVSYLFWTIYFDSSKSISVSSDNLYWCHRIV